jgi:hypothetical protein
LMAQGKIMAEGGAKETLTNRDLVTQAFIVPPQVSQIFFELSDLKLPTNVIDVYDARKVLLDRLEVSS